MRLTGSGAPLRPGRAARVTDLVVMALLVAVQFAQRPGQTTFDTKFDLSVDPAGVLAKSLHLWNPQLSFGELQTQAYGYLFPPGPFFVVAEWVHLPTWVAQRLWSGLLLVVAVLTSLEPNHPDLAALPIGAGLIRRGPRFGDDLAHVLQRFAIT